MDLDTFFDRPARMDALLWPEVRERYTELLGIQEYVNTLPAKYVVKVINSSIKDLGKFQNDDRFPQEDITKWLKMFGVWLQDAMERDVSINNTTSHVQAKEKNVTSKPTLKRKREATPFQVAFFLHGLSK